MSHVRSMMLAAVGAAMAGIVLVAATTTSQASFAASTENTANLWEAAELSLDVVADGPHTTQLFLNAEGLYPGAVVSNCVLVSIDSSLESVDLRLHGSMAGQSLLQDYVEVTIEHGAPSSPSTESTSCTEFEPAELLFSGDLAALTSDHGSFDEGLSILTDPKGQLPLRFTGSIQDDNAAQGLSLDYVVMLEARP